MPSLSASAAAQRLLSVQNREVPVTYNSLLCAISLEWLLAGSQCAVNPPSIGSATPITKLAPGLQSQRTAAAISSDRPSRPIG